MSGHFLATIPHLFATAQDHQKSGLTYSTLVDPENIRQAATLCKENGYHLEDVSVSEVQEGTVVLYHFDHWGTPGRICVMAMTSTNSIETISDIYAGADWHERECFDFFGTVFTGHKNLLPLLLTPDMETPPLKKADKNKVALATLFPWASAPAPQKEA